MRLVIKVRCLSVNLFNTAVITHQKPIFYSECTAPGLQGVAPGKRKERAGEMEKRRREGGREECREEEGSAGRRKGEREEGRESRGGEGGWISPMLKTRLRPGDCCDR